MTAPVRILHLEDEDNDAELISMELDSQSWPHEIVRVQSQKTFAEALSNGAFDVILADNSGPAFSGLDALAVARGKCPQIPFLFVTGTAEGNSAAAMKSGSDGYILKHELHALVPAIQRALQKK